MAEIHRTHAGQAIECKGTSIYGPDHAYTCAQYHPTSYRYPHRHAAEYPSACSGCEHLAADLAARLPEGLLPQPKLDAAFAEELARAIQWVETPNGASLPPFQPFYERAQAILQVMNARRRARE